MTGQPLLAIAGARGVIRVLSPVTMQCVKVCTTGLIVWLMISIWLSGGGGAGERCEGQPKPPSVLCSLPFPPEYYPAHLRVKHPSIFTLTRWKFTGVYLLLGVQVCEFVSWSALAAASCLYFTSAFHWSRKQCERVEDPPNGSKSALVSQQRFVFLLKSFCL